MQPPPATQAGQVPPQSTSVSEPFNTPSLHRVSRQMPPAQNPVVQSRGTRHAPGGGQGAHVLPPQSTSVSEPFFTASEHVGARQAPALQIKLTQSAFSAQPSPEPHAPHDPPQSTS